MVGVADFSDPLFGSSESIVEETDEDSSLQSDNENIVVCLWHWYYFYQNISPVNDFNRMNKMHNHALRNSLFADG